MFEGEKEIPMRDDGLGGDDTAEDGVWTAIIPTSINSAGWMLRYAIKVGMQMATRCDGRSFPNPRDSAAYLGLVIHDARPSRRSCPWFTCSWKTPAWLTPILALEPLCFMTENFTTTSTSVFTARALEVFQRKVTNLDFNQDHRFAYQSDAKRVKDIRLMTQWGDKSRVRNTLAYEMIQKAGSHGHFCFPVRFNAMDPFSASRT